MILGEIKFCLYYPPRLGGGYFLVVFFVWEERKNPQHKEFRTIDRT